MKKLILILIAGAAIASYSHRAHADDANDLVKTMQAQDAARQSAIIEQVLRDADNEAAIDAMCEKRYPLDGSAMAHCEIGLLKMRGLWK